MFKESAGAGKNCHMYLTLMNKLVQVKAELNGGQSTIFMNDSDVVQAIVTLLVQLKTAKRDLK